MIRSLVPEIFFVELYVVRFEKRQILLLKSSSPMMFGLMVDITDRFWQLRNAHTECTVPLLPTEVSQFPEGLMNPG